MRSEEQENQFREFIERIMKSYLGSRPSQKSIDKAFSLLIDKTRRVTSASQADVIGNMSKRLVLHVAEKSKFHERAWRKHLELDDEIRRAKERLSTEIETSMGGKIEIGGIGVGAKRTKRRALRLP